MKKLSTLLLTLFLLTMGVLLFGCRDIMEINVNFIVDDTVYATVGTSGNEEIKLPENPTKEGYTFGGWYWDKDVWEKPFTANSLLEIPLSSDMSDMNVYAKWELDTATPLPEGTDISSVALTLNGDTAYTSLSNETETFSFINDITVANGASFIVARDISCEQAIASKIAPLETGDNVFYVLVTNGNAQKLYTVTVRRRPMYTVTFNANGGSSVSSQTIEEGGVLNAPQETVRAGYTFAGWNADLTAPITANTTITAQWTAHTNTPYKVEYYKENVDKNGYDLVETQNLTGTTDTTVNAEQKTFERFTLNTQKSTLSASLSGNGNLVLKVYYTRDTYTVSANTSHGNVSNAGNYGYGKEVTLKASPNIGYKLLGWYSNNELLSTDTQYTVTIDKNIEARFAVNSEMQNFNFTSTATTCNITGIKDKTVTSIVVPDYVTSISQGAFSGCTSLESITIPFVGSEKDRTHYTHFGYIFGAMFSGYNNDYVPSSLKTVIITGGTSIDGSAFRDCSGITSFTIPDSVTSIGAFAFEDTGYYNNEANWENDVLYIGKHLIKANFSITGSYTVKDGTLCIADYAFSSISDLTSVTIPNSVKTIGTDAFWFCHDLTSITIGNGVTSIGDGALNNCESLTSINYRGSQAEWNAISKGSRWNEDTGSYTITYNYTDE